MRKPSQIAITFGLAKYMLLATFRNRNSLIFGLLFPLIFVEVFGSFGGGGASKTGVGITNELKDSNAPLIMALERMNGLKDGAIKLEFDTRENLRQQVSQGKLGAEVEQSGDGPAFTIVTSSANPIGGATASGILQSVSSHVNLSAAELAAGPEFLEPVQLKTEDVSGKMARYIDFVLPGMIGFSLISTATFGIAFPFFGAATHFSIEARMLHSRLARDRSVLWFLSA